MENTPVTAIEWENLMYAKYLYNCSIGTSDEKFLKEEFEDLFSEIKRHLNEAFNQLLKTRELYSEDLSDLLLDFKNYSNDSVNPEELYKNIEASFDILNKYDFTSTKKG